MKHNQIITLMLIISMSVLPCQFAISEPVNTDTFIFIESRFKLWDSYEKMLDNDFNITIIDTNITRINFYEIEYSDKHIFGNFTKNITINCHVNNSIINILIRLNNNTILIETGIKITGGITANAIENIQKPFVISLSPFQWNRKQWNIFFSVIVSALISIVFAYLTVMRYRKIKGGTVIK